MLDIVQKRKLRNFMYHKVTLGLLLVIVLLMIHSTWVVYQKKRESKELMTVSQNHVEDLRKREGDLDQKIKRLDTEAGIEEEIRAKFSVVKENENMIIVVDEEKSTTTVVEERKGFWQKLKRLFKGE